MTTKMIIFFIITAVLIGLSRKYLFNPRYHGFYRFFIFEFMLALILLNADHWFLNPFAALQIISWLLLLSSLILAFHGFYLIRTAGKPENGFDNTTSIISRGAYKYVRHPLYSSLIVGSGGVLLKNPSIIGGILFMFVCISGFLTAKTEEYENLEKFGEYKTYMEKTKMFIPYLF